MQYIPLRYIPAKLLAPGVRSWAGHYAEGAVNAAQLEDTAVTNLPDGSIEVAIKWDGEWRRAIWDDPTESTMWRLREIVEGLIPTFIFADEAVVGYDF